MSEKNTEEGAAPPKAKSKLLLFIGIGVLVLALVGGGAAFMLMKKKPAEGEDGEEEVAEETSQSHGKKDGKHEPPVFVKMDTFTVRLQNEGQDSYLQVIPELRVLDAHMGETVKQYNPEMRHRALLLMAAKTPQELNTPAGVEQLAKELRAAFNKILAPEPPKKKGKKKEVEEEDLDTVDPSAPVQAVLFTSFIVQ